MRERHGVTISNTPGRGQNTEVCSSRSSQPVAMKRYIFILMLLWLSQAGAQIPSAPTDYDSAIKYLSATQPLLIESYQVEIAETNDRAEKDRIAASFRKRWKDALAAVYSVSGIQKQMNPTDIEQQMLPNWQKSIELLHASHREVDAGILIPFLKIIVNHIPRNGNDAPRDWDDAPLDVKTSRELWPTLTTIMDMPNAAQALEKYVINSNNPAIYRVDAFDVLNCLDKEGAAAVATQLKENIEKSASPSKGDMLKYIGLIEKVDPPKFQDPFEYSLVGIYVGSSPSH